MHGRLAQAPLAGWIAGTPWPPEGLALGGLVEWLLAWRSPWRWLSERIVFDAAGYHRIPLLRRPDLEVCAIAWLPGQATRVHGHGVSVGAARVLVGALEERRYVTDAETGLAAQAPLRHRAPGLLREERGSVHRVEAVGPGPTVSLHVYSPPLPPLDGR